jgi:hypothetical protein
VRRHLLVAATHAAHQDPAVDAAEAATGRILIAGPADVRRLLADVGSLAR